MVQAPGVRAPRGEAEGVRRRLLDLGVLRPDLQVARDGGDVVFPVVDTCGPGLNPTPFEFQPRDLRPAAYQELLGWPEDLLAQAPRAFDALGDIVIVKVPPALWDRRGELGEALLRFHGARAAFHDHGVQGVHRVRSLEPIAGTGPSLTQVAESGVRLWVDPAAAYFSPRLASERAREAALVRPGHRFIDLFAGVAPLAIQAALKGAHVDAVDINPDAVVLARRNVAEAKVADRVALHEGDARAVGPTLKPAQHVAMNLPHGAKEFLGVAAPLLASGGILHHHEMLAPGLMQQRGEGIAAELAGLGCPARLRTARVVRNYSPQEAHVVFDLQRTD